MNTIRRLEIILEPSKVTVEDFSEDRSFPMGLRQSDENYTFCIRSFDCEIRLFKQKRPAHFGMSSFGSTLTVGLEGEGRMDEGGSPEEFAVQHSGARRTKKKPGKSSMYPIHVRNASIDSCKSRWQSYAHPHPDPSSRRKSWKKDDALSVRNNVYLPEFSYDAAKVETTSMVVEKYSILQETREDRVETFMRNYEI